MINIYAGTSGFSYKEWKGPFYPEDLPQKGMLGFYASKLRTVEINNTFYRMPKTETVERWAEQVGADFRFVIKASRRITHQGRLKDVDESVSYLWDKISFLGDRLGAVLFQTPPYLKRDDEKLRTFIEQLPEGCRGAFEFRSSSWFCDETYDAIVQGGHTLVVADTEAELPTPLLPSKWGYLRLRKDDYTDDELKAWREKIDASGWDEAFVFFKHEDDGAAAKMAMRMQAL